ncbi:cell division suppressor protein YneA [Lysinibacillus sp. 2017]|uniref:cell division suppressor protein YneA n=1 Tax=unclassified Lysinibacillus TaxID=2636778 RepID=UPI000D52673F|nr:MULTISPECIES: LysM peptidoglycan-binding domain-containing protein [unclassified Lysinibacillus]AWE08088.1 cell division suppressor protein YneA [Lysinibacillus sp. 2017]TGN36408.1 LysM peptidoglycan-binding domain-containing protein [Lysinibacillus sp. S2017]
MKNLKLNSFAAMFLAFSVFFIGIIVMKDDQIELYEQVTIEHGDTLWTIAEQYRGKMEKHDWIHAVKKQNELSSEEVVSGQILNVPVEKNADYITKSNEPNYAQSIKVVRENNESK